MKIVSAEELKEMIGTDTYEEKVANWIDINMVKAESLSMTLLIDTCEFEKYHKIFNRYGYTVSSHNHSVGILQVHIRA